MRKLFLIITCICLSVPVFAQNFRELKYYDFLGRIVAEKDSQHYYMDDYTGHYYHVPFTLKSKSEVMEYLGLIGTPPIKFSKTAKNPVKGEGNYTYFHSVKDCVFDKENETIQFNSNSGGYYQKIVFNDDRMEVDLVRMVFQGTKEWDIWCKVIIKDGYTLLHEELNEDNVIEFTYTKMGENPNFYVTIDYNRDFAMISIARKGDAQNIIESYIQEYQKK